VGQVLVGIGFGQYLTQRIMSKAGGLALASKGIGVAVTTRLTVS